MGVCGAEVIGLLLVVFVIVMAVCLWFRFDLWLVPVVCLDIVGLLFLAVRFAGLEWLYVNSVDLVVIFRYVMFLLRCMRLYDL